MLTVPTFKPYVATATIEAINAAIENDQGNEYRRLFGEAIKKAKDPFRSDEKPFRKHLGASLIGRDCARELWYSFRWSRNVVHKGQLLRLFNRGHLEEPRFIAALQVIGCQVWQTDGNGDQFRIQGHDPHFGGSLDVVVRGIPEMPDVPLLGEFKTHGQKSFDLLIAQGVRSAKYEHFVQCQIYMGSYGLTHTLYLAVNKNTDELYGEIISFDQEQYSAFVERAQRVIYATEPPVKINNSPGWFKCKMCDFNRICHFEEPKARNCRTCKQSSPEKDGIWICNNAYARAVNAKGIILTEEDQRNGCPSYSPL